MRGVLQVPLGVRRMGSGLPARGSATIRQTSRSPLQQQLQRHVAQQPTMMQTGSTASLPVPHRLSNTAQAPPRDVSREVPSPLTIGPFPQLVSAPMQAVPAPTNRTTHPAGGPKAAENPPVAKPPEASQAPQLAQALQGPPIPPQSSATVPAPGPASPPESPFPLSPRLETDVEPEQPRAVSPLLVMPVLAPLLPEAPTSAPVPAVFHMALASVPVVPSVAPTTGSPARVAVSHPPAPQPVPEPTPAQSPPPPPAPPVAASAARAASGVIPPASSPKRPHEDGESASIGDDTASVASLQGSSRKRSKLKEVIRPVGSPVQEPALEIPEVSEADVGKLILSETMSGTLTGVVEKFTERNGLGMWSIRCVPTNSLHTTGGVERL